MYFTERLLKGNKKLEWDTISKYPNNNIHHDISENSTV